MVMMLTSTLTANNNDQQPDIIEVNDISQADDTHENEEVHHDIFDATVMASVIAEATADIDEDQFIGASFAQLQDVDDVYKDNEPDLVCCAHIVDIANAMVLMYRTLAWMQTSKQKNITRWSGHALLPSPGMKIS
jgi:hypothetical protein